MTGKASLSLMIVAVVGLLALCGSAWAVDGNEPIAYWQFDEGSGDTAYDWVGENHGTIYGAEWTTGQVNGALTFDGDGDYVDLDSHVTKIEGLNEGTIAGWFNSPENATQYIFSITWGSSASDFSQVLLGPTTGAYDDEGFGFLLRRANQYKLVMYVRNGEYAYTDGEWHHFAICTGGGDNRIYIDGVNQTVTFHEGSSSTNEFSDIDNPDSMKIGVRIRNNTYECYFNGTLDDVRIYDRALSGEEIQELYYAGLSGTELAILLLEDAIAEKAEMLELIDETLEKEWSAYDALDELLTSGDYGGLNKRDIVTAKQKIRSAIQRQERSKRLLEESIQKLEDSLAALGYEPPADGPVVE